MDEPQNNKTEGEEPRETQPEGELDKLRRERDEYRARADFSNYRKEEASRFAEIAKYQTEDMMYDLITVLDNFELALTALEKQGPVEKGIYMIRSQMEDILKRRGLVRIQVKPGDPFDPAVAEAIAEAESDLPPGSVVEEIEAGYRFHDRILRPARVKVAKSKQ
jgi:molecular chaperone GrpE